jgi:hypothetical protein
MHTSLRHYAITIEHEALGARSIPLHRVDRAVGTRRDTRRLRDRIPSLGRAAGRPAFG